MLLLFNVILFFLNLVQSTAQSCTHDKYGELHQMGKVGGKYRMTTIQEGDYIIQALITLSNDDLCSKVSRDGLIRSLAMRYAVEKFNSNPRYSNYGTLGLQIDDVCKDLPITMARGIEVVSFYRENSVCRMDFLKCDSGDAFQNVTLKQASAIIGTAMSFTTIPLASLMSLYFIPQVSFSATSRLLSKKDLYKSFFRTIPPDTSQISVMIDIFKRFEWNYIIAIGSDDDYGKLGVSGLKQEASKNDICIMRDLYIPYKSQRTKHYIQDVVQAIKAETKATVVVLFCYSEDLGDLILHEAQKQDVYRIWLTSEAWNPSAATLFSKQEWRHLQNETHGLLSVALKRPKMDYLLNWIENFTTTNYSCDMWFKQYISQKYQCDITSFDSSSNQFICDGKPTNKSLHMKNVMKDLAIFPGHVGRLIDAVTSIGAAIYKVKRSLCPNPSNCSTNNKPPVKRITEEMFNTDFTNEQGERMTFDTNGNPRFAYYTVENLVFNEEKQHFEFIQVGDWNQNRTGNPLLINESIIQWPFWFNGSNKATASDEYVSADFPASRCSDKCPPGYYVVGKQQCCWACQKCVQNNYSDHEMAPHCYSCGDYSYTLNNLNCTLTPIKWIKINDTAGMAIVIISIIGLLVSIVTTQYLFRNWNLIMVHEVSAPLMRFVCVLLFVTFVYGPIHVFEPTNRMCQVRNSYFFVMLMMYCGFVLTKTQSMIEYLQSYADMLFQGNILFTQFVFLFLLFLLEAGTIGGWLYSDGIQFEEFRGTATVVQLIEKQCRVDFTAARLISTFIPCIILIIATFCAFRERNADHSFYEPKFLSFACIALCIVIVAFLPTFNYVFGIYKAIVWAFTMNVFGWIFIICLVLPKIYVGIMRKRRGINVYPMRPGIIKKDKVKTKKKKKMKKGGDEIKRIERSDISFRTKSTIAEGIDEVVDGKSSEINTMEKEVKRETLKSVTNGYCNETYESGDFDVENGDDVAEEFNGDDESSQHGTPPPDYQTSISVKNAAAVENTTC